MMRKRKRSVMSMAAAVMIGTGGVVGVAYGQEADRSEEREKAASQMEQREKTGSLTEHRTIDAEGRLLEASDVVKYKVLNQQGDALGTISELAIDTRRGQIAYAIVKLEEPLALKRPERTGEAPQTRQDQKAKQAQREASELAVPWTAFRIVSGKETLELTINRDKLAQGHGFDDQWEQLSDRQWATRQHRAFGLAPYWEGKRMGDHKAHERARVEQPPQDRATDDAATDGDMHAAAPRELHVEALSELIGRKVHNAQDESLAEVDDFMIDTRHGHIAYAILNYGGVLGIGSSYVAMPYQAFELDLEEERFVLDVDQDKLDQLAFSKGERPEMTDGPWAQRVHEVFGQEPYWQVFGYSPPSEAAKTTKEEVKSSTEPESDQK